MHKQRMGATLFELLIVLLLVGVFATLTAPRLQTAREVFAVRAGRESAFGLFTRARAIALQHGGAEIELSAREDRITIRSVTGATQHELLLGPHDVDLLPDSSADPIRLRYDAYGLGRMMSRTLIFASGSARSGLTVSSFGRVRRW